MKFGRLDDISGVDLSLPVDHAGNRAIFDALPKSDEKPTLYVGCTGWTMPAWKGTYYPEKLAAKNFLEHYSKQFNTIEFNSTHYTIPKVDTVKRWKTESADDFIFCPKVFKFISHTKTLGTDGDNITRMVDSLVHLEEKLGPLFIQLPPYFGADRLGIIEQFLKYWDNHISISWELRHPSWYSETSALDDLQQLLMENGHTLLLTDVAGRRDVMHMRISGDYLMLRWVGNALHPTDYTRIDQWADRIAYYTQNGIKKVYFFTHEPDNILAPDIAAYLCTRIRENNHAINTRGPRLLGSDSQLKLF